MTKSIYLIISFSLVLFKSYSGTPETDTVYVIKPIPDTTIYEDEFYHYNSSDVFFTNVENHEVICNFEIIDVEESWVSYNQKDSIYGTPLQEHIGSYKIRLFTTGFEGELVADTFNINVLEINDTPVVSKKIPNQLFMSGDKEIEINITDIFIDEEDGSDLTIEVESSNESVVGVTLNQSDIKVSPASEGQAKISLVALDSDGASVESQFLVQVYGQDEILEESTLTTGSNGLVDNRTNFTFSDDEGVMYIGTEFGISTFNEEQKIWDGKIFSDYHGYFHTIWKKDNKIKFYSRGSVIEYSGNEWKDVTQSTKPKKIDYIEDGAVTQTNDLYLIGTSFESQDLELELWTNTGWESVATFEPYDYVKLENWGDSLIVGLANKLIIFFEGQEINTLPYTLESFEKIKSFTPINSDSLVVITDQKIVKLNNSDISTLEYNEYDGGKYFANHLITYRFPNVVIFNSKFESWTIELPNILEGVSLDYLHFKDITIEEDSSAWITSNQGIFSIDNILSPTPFINHFHTLDGIPSNEIIDIISTDEKTYVHTSYGTSTFSNNEWSFLGTSVRPHLVASDESIWFSPSNLWPESTYEIKYYDGINWHTIPEEDIPLENVYDISEDDSGNKWVAGVGGLAMFDGESWISYNTTNGLLANTVGQVFIDSENKKWVSYTELSEAELDIGISVLSGSEWIHFNDEKLASFQVGHMSEGHEKIWVSTWNNGIVTIDQNNNLNFINPSNGELKADYVEKTFIDPNNNAWFVYDYTQNLGLSVLSPDETWVHFDVSSGLSSNAIKSLAFQNINISDSRRHDASFIIQVGSNSFGMQTLSSIEINTDSPSKNVTSISSLKSMINIHPNPTSSTIRLDPKSFQGNNIQYSIASLNGEIVLNDKISNIDIPYTIDISNLIAGVYIIQVGDGVSLYSQKIIKH